MTLTIGSETLRYPFGEWEVVTPEGYNRVFRVSTLQLTLDLSRAHAAGVPATHPDQGVIWDGDDLRTICSEHDSHPFLRLIDGGPSQIIATEIEDLQAQTRLESAQRRRASKAAFN